jgi:hypothetical protein
MSASVKRVTGPWASQCASPPAGPPGPVSRGRRGWGRARYAWGPGRAAAG